mmetsp:Transcript_64542/g.144194  ORF Transcript_64542/g.144194 Transcript_64542/m.144194 type:complete len:102 (-) Transcript_64542:524-829(-)
MWTEVQVGGQFMAFMELFGQCGGTWGVLLDLAAILLLLENAIARFFSLPGAVKEVRARRQEEVNAATRRRATSPALSSHNERRQEGAPSYAHPITPGPVSC